MVLTTHHLVASLGTCGAVLPLPYWSSRSDAVLSRGEVLFLIVRKRIHEVHVYYYYSVTRLLDKKW
jgi:hypothetical protein